jgi:hypothetical protein
MEWIDPAEAEPPQWSAPMEQCWARPTIDDVRLIECLSAFVAASSRCTACGRPLSGRLELLPGVHPDASTWAMVAVTRCRGWRRHRHSAAVTESSRDLIFEQFHR